MELEFSELLGVGSQIKLAHLSYSVAQLTYRKKEDVRQKFEFC
jgi:hypothetical protein